MICHVSSGWRVGWAIAPTFLASAIKNIHARVTDCAPAPFQEAALSALRSPPEYFESLRSVRDQSSKFDGIIDSPQNKMLCFLIVFFLVLFLIYAGLSIKKRLYYKFAGGSRFQD